MMNRLKLFIVLIISLVSTYSYGQITLKKLIGEDNITDRTVNDQFGASVAISGDIAVVGTPLHDFDSTGGDSLNSAGAAYVFYKNEGGANNWGLKKKLVAYGNNSRNENDKFGNSVAISGDIIVVGALNQDFNASGLSEFSDAGAAYVFYKDEGGTDNWGLKEKLVGRDINGRLAEDNFGNTVAISGNIIAVGAYQQDYNAAGASRVSFAGAVYVFYKDEGGTDNWGLKQKLTGGGTNGRLAGDFFGASLAMTNTVIAVGANLQDYNENGNVEQTDAGAVYLFYKDEGGTDNWGFVKKLIGAGSNGRLEEDNFGISVAISGNTVVVGAYLQDFDANGTSSVDAAGAAYVFDKDKGGTDNWGFVKKLVGGGTNGRVVGDNFGIAVSITGDVIVVGATQQDYNAIGDSLATGAGAIYIFHKDQGGIDNWGLLEKITATGTNARNGADNFGNAIATAPDVILVGAFGHDFDANGSNPINNAGAVFAYNYPNINPNSVKELLNSNTVFVSSHNKEVYLNFKKANHYTVTVYDLVGKKLHYNQTKVNSSTIEQIDLNGAKAGYYIVNISNGKAQKSFKVFLH